MYRSQPEVRRVRLQERVSKFDGASMEETATLFSMKRLLLLVACGIGVALALWFVRSGGNSSHAVSVGVASSSSSFSSSLNLIVRVSPLLRRQQTPAVGSSATPSSAAVPYDFYTSADQLSGRSVVLFFVDVDDPFSIAHDAFISTLSVAGLLKVPVYRIDFATASGRRVALGVVVSDTFVLLDAKGQRVSSLIHPRNDELKVLLTSAHL